MEMEDGGAKSARETNRPRAYEKKTKDKRVRRRGLRLGGASVASYIALLCGFISAVLLLFGFVVLSYFSLNECFVKQPIQDLQQILFIQLDALLLSACHFNEIDDVLL